MVTGDGALLDQYLAAVYAGPGVQVVGQAFAVDTGAVCLPVGGGTQRRLSVLKAGYDRFDVALTQLNVKGGVATITLTEDTASKDAESEVRLDPAGDPLETDEPVGLPNDTITLPEALLRVKRRARLVGNNDTTSYLAADLRDTTDRTVADLLAKIPGMQLREDGQLAYRGNNVSRVLIDGNDVFGTGGYAEPVRRLGSGLVAEVNAIERFHEDAVLAMLEPSNETVIDLVSSESYRGRFVGEAPVAAGAATSGEPRYQAGVNGTFLTRRRSLYVDANVERLDRLITNSPSTFTFDRSLEPIGRLPQEAPALRPPRVLVRTLAPTALIGDAIRRGAVLNYHHRSATGDRFVARVSHSSAADVLGATTSLTARETDAGSIAYDLTEQRATMMRPSSWLADLTYDGTASNRRRTWKIVGLVRRSEQSFSDELRLSDPAAQGLPELFPLGSSGTQFTGVLGLRVNQRLGSALAGQAFVDGGAASVREEASLRLAANFTIDSSLALPAGQRVSQATDLDYAFWRAGGKVFARVGAALLDLQVVSGLHRYATMTEIGLDAERPDAFAVHPTYRITDVSAGVSAPLSARWRARAALGAKRLAGPFAGGRDARVMAVGYDLSAERVAGKRPALSLVARRSLTLPTPAPRLGLPQLRDPLSLSRELIVPTAQVQELVTARWRRSYTSGKGNAAAEVTYVWRQRELAAVYRLDGRARELGTGRVLGGSSVFVQTRGDQHLSKAQSIVEWHAGGVRQRQEVNLESTHGSYTRTEVTGEVRYYWLKSAGLLPKLELSAAYSEVGGALRARTGFVSGEVSLRFRVSGIFVTPSCALQYVLVEQQLLRAFLNGGLDIAYPLRRRTEGFPPNLTLSVRNAFRQSTAKMSTFESPFLVVTETATAPMSIWLGYRIPLAQQRKSM